MAAVTAAGLDGAGCGDNGLLAAAGMVLVLAAWTGLLALSARPDALHLPGVGAMGTFTIGIMLYLPLGVLAGPGIARLLLCLLLAFGPPLRRAWRQLRADAPPAPGPVVTLTLQSHIEDCWDEPVLGDGGSGADLGALQGAWFSVSGRREAELLISGHHFAFRFADGDIYMGAFDLDATTSPKLAPRTVTLPPKKPQPQVSKYHPQSSISEIAIYRQSTGGDARLLPELV